ncbi:MAG: ABC transporter ATP-binding protein/permease, partial [Actinobacteria bacterium]|nr:ABC transporter ATP-binding protein/permease [Actinomycetota bacterium]
VLGVLETTLVYLVAQLGLSMQASTKEIRLGGGPLPTVVVSLGEGVLIAALTLIVTAGLAYPLARLSAEMSRRTLVRQRGGLIHEYLSAGWEYRSGSREGHLQDLMGDYANRSEKVVDVISTILASTCGMLAIGVGALLIAPSAAVIITLGVVAVGLLLRPLAVRLKAVSTGWLVENQKLMSRIAQTSRMSAEVTAFDVGPSVERGALAEIDDSAVQTAELRAVGRLTPQLFLYGAFGLVLIVIGVVNISGSIDFTSVGPLLLLLVRALGYGKLLQSAVQGGIEFAPSIRALESEIAALREHRAPRGTVVASRIGTVHLEDVGFEYTPGRSVLREVNLKIAPGDAIAVVGPSGGGKTTLTQLLMRLRQPTTGRIVMDGVDIGDIARSCWARLVAYVPQDNQLIRASVADNIRFYRSGVSDSEVERAARSAHLHDEIVDLPRGYETPIGQGERDLSGGQRQRLGLARALVGQPGLLVLDEPTSALDQRSEQLIRQVLFAKCQIRTAQPVRCGA